MFGLNQFRDHQIVVVHENTRAKFIYPSAYRAKSSLYACKMAHHAHPDFIQPKMSGFHSPWMIAQARVLSPEESLRAQEQGGLYVEPENATFIGLELFEEAPQPERKKSSI